MSTLIARLNKKRKEIVTLSNGLRVANFSSPHAFTFTDGTVLPEVSDDESLRLKVEPNPIVIEELDNYKTVNLSWALTSAIMWEMNDWEELHKSNEVDIVLCPLPMMVAMSWNPAWREQIIETPFRAVRMEDRIKKLVSIDTFTLP